jgi:Family of unknown function (DUF6111)
MRQIVEIVLPLILPTLIYFGYVLYARARGAEEVPEMPWAWLGVAGGLLLGVTFLALALFGGAPPSDVYLPPKIVDGKVQPGHFEPAGN